ncbi:uncharacterized protein LOC117190382 [Drosophila miranda]|uniref:uncharacterized protein LOC117190382 n=1 Tax=Drosophila miranda TaxID=7229 RepID=UPI00143F5EA7|nr:uncharacterized protein LOC117190382 [Drosophila miranda]
MAHNGKALTGRYNATPTYGFDNEQNYCLLPSPMPPPPYALARVSSTRNFELENHTPPACPGSGPIAMTNGTIQLRLRDGVRRYAKMWYKGVSFTSEACALIYLVDTAGTRTTTDTFTDLTKDYTLAVFYDDSRHGPSYMAEAHDVIANSAYTCTEDGTEIYDINGFRITQAADGLVKVFRVDNKCLIRTSPGNGSATLTTPGIHCTASLGKTSHLFVRKGEKKKVAKSKWSKSVEPKVSTKEAQCQSSDCETSQQEPVSQVSSPKGARVGIFNAEDFLSRAQMNDKINILSASAPSTPTTHRR